MLKENLTKLEKENLTKLENNNSTIQIFNQVIRIYPGQSLILAAQ